MVKDFDISQFVDVLTVQTVLADLAARAKKRRKEAGFTQKTLALRSGVSFGSVRRFEKTGEISLYSLLRIGQALNLLSDFCELFKNPIITNLKDYKV